MTIMNNSIQSHDIYSMPGILRKMRMSSMAKALEEKLKELKAELFNLRFQHAINQLDNPHKMTEVKHDIARVMTVLQEMKKEEA